MGCSCGGSKTSSPEKKGVPINKNKFGDVYELICLIGTGSNSELWLVEHRKTCKERAAKIIKKSKKTPTTIEEIIKDQLEELEEMECTNVVKIYEAFEDTNYYYIVMEELRGRNISEYLAMSSKSALTEQTAAQWTKQVLEGLQECHAKGIVHKDIKPSNIMFADEEAKVVKLIDFGLEQNYEPDENAALELYASPAFVAPETVTTKKYSAKSDVWSCGILLYNIIAGKIPYEGKTLKELSEEIKNTEFTEASFKEPVWQKVSPACKRFIAWMLTKTPEERPNVNELLADDWLKNDNTTPLVSDDPAYEAEIAAGAKARLFAHAVRGFIANQWNRQEAKTELAKVLKNMENKKQLTKTELKEAFTKSGLMMAGTEFNKLFAELNKDGSGTINYQDCLEAINSNDVMENDKPLKKAFDLVADGENKTIKKETLNNLMNSGWMAEVNMASLFKEVHTSSGENVRLF